MRWPLIMILTGAACGLAALVASLLEMPKPWRFIAFLTPCLLVIVVTELHVRRKLRPFWSRRCTGAQWRKCFPNATSQDIRRFLDLFIDAFAFSQKRGLAFAPDDRIMDVYRALYPYGGMADALELETLFQLLERQYSLQLAPIWHEGMTLGELFQQARDTRALRDRKG